MKKRVISGLIMLALILAIFYVRGITMLVFGSLLLIRAQYEVMHAFETREIKPYRTMVYFSGILLGTVVYFFGGQVGLIFLTACIFIQGVCILFFRDFVFDRLLVTLFSILYPALGFLAMFDMLLGNNVSYGHAFCAIFAAVGCDTFALLTGKAFGKHKLCPDISPNKTIEGAVGGVAGGMLVVIAAKALLFLFGINVPWSIAIFAGLVGSISSQAGDLVASGLKRYCGIKDFGSILPGHGGVMDRLDGILFSAITIFLFDFFINMF